MRLASTEEATYQNFNGAQINCEEPNEYLYKFQGTLTFTDGASVVLDPDQVLLRGSTLRNTEYILGVVVYTGHETKIMKNSTKAKAKKSKIQIATNKYILLTMLFQFILSVSASCVSSIWAYTRGGEFWYIWPLGENREQGLVVEILINTGVWFINLMNFVPISLLVTLEMINFIQAYFIEKDANMIDMEKHGMTAKCQSSNLNEELGMVHYIFSDKTGTLTQNVMEFKRFSAGMYEYGSESTEPVEYEPGVTNVNFVDPRFYRDIADQNHENNLMLHRMLEALGLCHTILTE